jgi:hypothetical protein
MIAARIGIDLWRAAKLAQHRDHRLGCKAVAHGILPRAKLALLAPRASAFQSIDPVGGNLFERCHCMHRWSVHRAAGFSTR